MRKALAVVFFVVFSGSVFAQHNPADNNRTAIRESVSATAAQLSGKWNIVKIVNPRNVELPAEKVSGSNFTFNDDGTYLAMIMGVEEKGTWKFGPDNKNVHMFVHGMKTIWNILAVSDSELVMQKGVRGNTVTFTR